MTLRRPLVAVLPLLALLVLAACGGGGNSGSGSGSTSPSASATASPSGQVVKVHISLKRGAPAEPVALEAGDTLEVTLESDASTGFRWIVSEAPDATVLRLSGQQVLAPPPVPGTPTEQTLRFDAVAAGSTDVKFAYARVAANAKPEQVATLKVKVS